MDFSIQMSLPRPGVDFALQFAFKRKLEEYVHTDDEDEDDVSSELVSVRRPKMRKDHSQAVSSWSSVESFPTRIEPRVSDARSASCSDHAESSRSHSRLQFFVRMMSEGNTLVIQAHSDDTVKSIHEKIQAITGIPGNEQRLIYCGRQLQWEQSLADCLIQNDAGLQLVGRMRSTDHPQSWQLVNEMVSIIFRLCKGESIANKYVKSTLMEFMTMTPRTNIELALGHLRIFLSSFAPAALVMLFLSPIVSNRECADDAIRLFITSSKMVLPKAIHVQCAPIVLEFCNLLSKTAHDAPLYSFCRTSLGSIVECTGLEHEEMNGLDSYKGLLSVQDIFPFVSELATRLSHDLDSSMVFTSTMGPLLGDVHDFAAFLLPIRSVITKKVGFGEPIKIPFSETGKDRYSCPSLRAVAGSLYEFLIDLLGKMECCLQTVGAFLSLKEEKEKEKEKGENFRLGWSQYLTILKELNSLSKLYQGAEELFWSKMRNRKASICYLILRYAKRSDDHKWILEHKEVTNFEARRHLATMMLPEVKDEYEELHEMLIDRSHLLAESFEYIGHAEPESLRGGLFIEFKNEEATGPGVLREWFVLVCQELFNPQNALFVACPNDRRRFFPNPASKVDPMHLEYFKFSGRVIALALIHKVQVGIVFDRVFFLQLAGLEVSIEDIQDSDPLMYSSCKKVLEMDPNIVDEDTLGLTFAIEIEEMGCRKVVELCPNGITSAVNSSNRNEYVNLLIQHRFVKAVADQVAHFAKGFADIVGNEELQKFFFRSLEREDLDWMLHGNENAISVEDWRAHTEYNGYKETDPQIVWFWKIVDGMSAQERKSLLSFWTSVKYLPVGGFGSLTSRLNIYRTSEPFNRLPSSHTCFYRLCFPPYPTKKLMKARIGIITQEHIGCSFGNW